MSTYSRLTKNPKTGEFQKALWIDDFYGNHNYGVQFPDGSMYDPRNTKLETKDWNQENSNKSSDSSIPEEESIETMVRDFCSVIPRSKSEVRRRIKVLVNTNREEGYQTVREFDKNFGKDLLESTLKVILQEIKKTKGSPVGYSHDPYYEGRNAGLSTAEVIIKKHLWKTKNK